MKKIYIILTHTGTVLSKIIKKYTKDEFSHISIALDIELKKMYSFGRLMPSNPFFAGFVHEYVNKGTFKRFYKTMAKVYSLEVTEEQYNDIKNAIEQIEKERSNYKFNIIGLLAVGFNKRIKMKKSFYCAEFVKYVLEQGKINTGLPDMIKPEDFKKMEGLQPIYDGLLRKYNAPKRKTKIIENRILKYKKLANSI